MKGLKFNIVSFVALGISYLVFVLLCISFPKVDPRIHQAIGIVRATFVNYFFNTYWTFRHSPGKEGIRNIKGQPSPGLPLLSMFVPYSLILLFRCAASSFLMSSGDSFGRSTLIVSLLSLAVNGNGGL